MARPRDPNKTYMERAKLRTVNEINIEIRRLYRRQSNKQISPAEVKARVGTLTALRAGMADPVEQPELSCVLGININVVEIPYDHSVCPDGNTRPNCEAVPLWEAEHARRRAAENVQHGAEEKPLLQLEHSSAVIEVETETQSPPSEPAPELSPTMRRAMEMGFRPLPRRARSAD